LRLLLIDESASTRATYIELLSAINPGTDYAFEEASSAEQGLNACASWRPHCVLLDDRLPDMNSVAFLDAVSALAARDAVSVLILTGRETAESPSQPAPDGTLWKAELDGVALDQAIRAAVAKRSEKRATERARLQQLDELHRRLKGKWTDLLAKTESRRTVQSRLASGLGSAQTANDSGESPN
jgi:DNA-binding NarL/FixJ family response regulator